MKNHIRHNDSRLAGPLRLLASSVAVAAVVAGSAGVAAGQGHDAPDPGDAPGQAKVMKPKLVQGLLKVRGTRGDDAIALRLQAGNPGVVEVVLADGSAVFPFDRAQIAAIAVDARAGDDSIRIDESSGVFTDKIPTLIDGGAGDDTIAGGTGDEILVGGDGNDTIDGNRGNDTAFMGAGDDSFIWDPGDGSDVVEGQDGHDVMVFNGANAAERVDLSANGDRLRFFRDPAGIVMDTHGVEQVDFNALGGADAVNVNDLSGTGVTSVNLDLAGTLGGAAGDSQADRVIVNGTDGNDAIAVKSNAGAIEVSGLAATVAVEHAEAANDRLEINTLAGADAVDSRGLAPGAIQLVIDGQLVP